MSEAASFAFIAGALDRADELRRDPTAIAGLRGNANCLWLDAEGRTAINNEGAWLPSLGDAPDDAVFLGLHGDDAWFAALLDAPIPDEAARTDLRGAAAQWAPWQATLFAQARAVLHWRASHRHCARCGAALTFSNGGWQGDCARCGATHYPRTDPAVIVAISDGERLLLGRQATWPTMRYSTLAGFVEPGESLEQAIVREVWEESRVRVTRSRYLASQPWPFPGSLMLGFIAHAEADTPRVEQDELEDARWWTREEVIAALEGRSGEGGLQVSPRLSISRWLIECWVAGERA